jgi:hypothetical protein
VLLLLAQLLQFLHPLEQDFDGDAQAIAASRYSPGWLLAQVHRF